MANSFSFGKIELVSSTEAAEMPARMNPEAPFRILVLGDFSGRANRGAVAEDSESARRPIRVDRDNFDQVMSGLGVELRLPVAEDEEGGIVLRFQELDDFHPDRIFEHTEVFQALREKRRAPNDPSTTRLLGVQTKEGPVREEPKPIETAPPSPADLLDQILAQTSGASPEPPRPRSGQEGYWDDFLDRITVPYRVPGRDPRQAEMVASLDAATSQLMRDILHHPDFQALEAAWRGLYFLTRRLDTDGLLSISLIDGTRADLESTRLDDTISAGPTGEQPWAVLIGDLVFESNPADLALLGRMAAIARRAGAPFLAAASPRLVGCDSLAAAPDPSDWQPESAPEWEALRRHSDAAYLGLALPRFLLRLPYGKDARPIESFEFEEIVEGSSQEDLLWGNPAFALAELLGRSFNQQGWMLRPESNSEIEELPLHVDKRGDEPEITPCAEVLLTDRAVEIILDKGLMPFRSIRNRDAISLARFQSISEPASPLAGRWG